MLEGYLQLGWLELVLVTLALTHVTIAAVTIFLHRSQAHRALDLHAIPSHFFRFWLWLTTGMVTAEWVGIHRRHHARCERDGDPHSPQLLGLRKVLWQGAELYSAAAKDPELIARYSHGTPNDWLERHVYSRWRWQGVGLMLIIDLFLFGPIGGAVWAVQMLWIPFWAAGVINGVGHFWGYRNFESPDAATNISPWGILIGGEELHNNHHAFPSSAKLSVKGWEFDIGWLYIRLMEGLGLAKVRRVVQPPRVDPAKSVVDIDTVRAVIRHRMFVMANYAKEVIGPVALHELAGSDNRLSRLRQQALDLVARQESRLDELSRARLGEILAANPQLATIHEFRRKLEQIWERTSSSQEALVQALQDWCRQAEATGIHALEEFAQRLRGLMPAPLPA